MKIGIFGGCFNPPHKMHKDISEKLIVKGYLDQVIFVPTGNNYNKAELVNMNYRIDMLNLVLNNQNTVVSDICKDLNYQYTFEILDYYQSQYPKDTIYFICGTDNLKEFDTWKKYEYVLTNYKLLVVVRNGNNTKQLVAKYEKYKDNICIVNIDSQDISSTLVRKWIKSEKMGELEKNIDRKVLKYIKEKGLYKN